MSELTSPRLEQVRQVIQVLSVRYASSSDPRFGAAAVWCVPVKTVDAALLKPYHRLRTLEHWIHSALEFHQTDDEAGWTPEYSWWFDEVMDRFTRVLNDKAWGRAR